MRRTFVTDSFLKTRPEDAVHQPVVVRVNEFTEASARQFAEDFEKAHATGQHCVPVVIDSFGGYVYSLLDMIAQVRASALPVVTVVEGKAMSCGAILFATGQRRVMAPHATLMLHDVSNICFGKLLEVEAEARETRRVSDLVWGLVDQNCGHADGYFESMLHELGHAEWYLSARHAKRHKLCTEIGVPELTTRLTVTHELTVR